MGRPPRLTPRVESGTSAASIGPWNRRLAHELGYLFQPIRDSFNRAFRER